MGETALLTFSFCLQSAIGIMILMTLGKQLSKGKQFKNAALAAAALSIIGVLASLAHLGQPMAALNSLLNLGSSWLSREVLFAGTFMGIAVLYAVVLSLKPEQQGLINLLGWAGSIVGLITVFSMSKLYATTAIPVWQGVNTFVDFYATTFAVGTLIFLALSFKELQDVDKKIFGFIVLASVIVQASVAVPYALSLGANGTAQASAQILSAMSTTIGLKWVLILGGAALLMWPGKQSQAAGSKASTGFIYGASIAIVCGQLIGRYVFYAAVIAPGVGLI